MIRGDLCLQMSCPLCGADLELVNERRLTAREHTSVWKCLECPTGWSIKVDMVPVVAPREYLSPPMRRDPGQRKRAMVDV